MDKEQIIDIAVKGTNMVKERAAIFYYQPPLFVKENRRFYAFSELLPEFSHQEHTQGAKNNPARPESFWSRGLSARGLAFSPW